MHAITQSEHPGDALGFLSAVTALLEDLCPLLSQQPDSLTRQGAEGLWWTLHILRRGLNETVVTFSPQDP